MSHINAELEVQIANREHADKLHALSDKEMYGKIEKLEDMVIELNKQLTFAQEQITRVTRALADARAQIEMKEDLWKKALDHFA